MNTDNFSTQRHGERPVLKDAAANDLAGDSGQHLVVARRQNVNAGNLGFLVQLLGAKFGHLFDALKNL